MSATRPPTRAHIEGSIGAVSADGERVAGAPPAEGSLTAHPDFAVGALPAQDARRESRRRRRAAAGDDVVQARLRALIAPGWTPPSHAEARPAPQAAVTERRTASRRPEGGRPEDGGAQRHDRPGPAATGGVVDRPGAGGESASVRRWLPDALLQARWDPRRRGVVAVVAAVLLAAGVVAFVVWHSRPVLVPVAAGRTGTAQPGQRQPTPTPPSPSRSQIVVAVAGKVRHPGLVRLTPGSRVADAVAGAGGVLPGADIGLLNLAKVVSDGEQIVVGIPPPTPAAPGSASADTGPVNINTASAEQLDELPGVGPATAQRIIDWRAANGPFTTLDQLQEVPGIGPAKYADIAPKATI